MTILDSTSLSGQQTLLINNLSQLKRSELKRIQGQKGSLKVSMVYLTMIQEAQNVVAYAINLIKVSRKFQDITNPVE